jgi:zinc protease
MRFAALSMLLTAALAIAGCAAPSEPAALPTTAPAKAEPAPLKVVQRADAPGGAVVARLENGLTVIVKPVHTAPVVCVRAYVRAGGLYEREYLGCGISHLCEHLVAKGALSEEAPGAEGAKIDQTRSIVSDIGGQSNASTSLACTQYYISAAAGKAMDCIDLVAGWMAHARIEAEDFRREHGVVQRELELEKDDPARQMWQAHAGDVFGGHPAGVPVIGYAEPLRKLTPEDVRTYHRRMYVPENMVFVVVGDVDGGAALGRAARAFAGFARTRVPELSLPEVRPLPGATRTVRPHGELKEVMQEISFQTVELLHADLHALDVLSTILGAGESSRLVSKLRRERRLVTSVSCASWTPSWGKGVFNVSFRAAPQNADEAERAVFDELRAVVEKGVTAAELARAKRQMIADFVYAQQSVESISAQLGGDYLATGDVTFSRSYTKRVEAVTAEQVHQAARRYFTFDRVAITRLVPPEQFAATAGGAKAGATSTTRTFRLPNGLRVVLHATDAVELVALAFATRGGLLVEGEATNGLGSLMTALSTKGAGGRSAEEIAEFFAQAGGGISGECGNNTFLWQASCLDDSFEKALAIFADVIQRPAFLPQELDILRPMQLAAIDRVQQSWFSELMQRFRGEFFGRTPYGMLSIGRKEVVKATSVEELAAHHRRCIRGGSSVLAIFGHFDPAAAEALVRRHFEPLPAGQVDLAIPPARKVAEAGELHLLRTQKKVAAVLVAASGMKVDNLQDRFAITVLDTIISGYELPGGWLHNELRGKQLVYVVHAYNWMGLAPGAFLVYAAGQPEKAPEVLRIIQQNLRRAARYTPTQQEIDRAVNTILTADLLGNQSMGSLAMSAALDELYGFGHDFRNKLESHYVKVTPADVARVARKYLSGGYVTVVTTPKPELIKQGQPEARE